MKDGHNRRIRSYFDAISGPYDRINRLLSLGRDQLWRRRSVDLLAQHLGARAHRVLDVCCGTGQTLRHLRARMGVESFVCGLDFSPSMLAACRADLTGRVALIRGDVRDLPFGSEVFEGISLTFALRNLDDRPQDLDTFLAEAFRVVRPGGALLLLETSQPENPLVRLGFHGGAWLVCTLAGLFTAQREPYRYLHRSIRLFPDRETLLARARSAGWVEGGQRRFWWGAVRGLLLVRPGGGPA